MMLLSEVRVSKCLTTSMRMLSAAISPAGAAMDATAPLVGISKTVGPAAAPCAMVRACSSKPAAIVARTVNVAGMPEVGVP